MYKPFGSAQDRFGPSSAGSNFFVEGLGPSSLQFPLPSTQTHRPRNLSTLSLEGACREPFDDTQSGRRRTDQFNASRRFD